MKKNLLKAIAVSAIAAISLPGCSSLNSNMLYGALGTATQALTLSDADILAYAQQSVAQMDAQANVAPANNKYTTRLNNLTKGLTSVDGMPLNFKVYLTNEINAFACPDGSVRVYSGIMDTMTDDELLGIIGHEVGHVAMKHSLNAMKHSLLNSALLQTIGATSSTAAALTQSELGQLAESYMSAKYSRKQENEADDFGYDFLKGAGKNPWAMVDAFEKMQALEEKAAAQGSTTQINSYLSNMFSDHPQTTERIKRMTDRANKDGIARPSKAATTSSAKKTTTKKK